MCPDVFHLLKKCLTESQILKYPNPGNPHTLFTDVSKYALACVLTQIYTHVIDGK